jgi:hypothetical protein
MNDFLIWFKLGTEHLMAPGALDHFLFLAILAVSYPPKDWKKILWLILAFTLGHSLSMLLGINLDLPLPEKWIEIGIALTILLSAIIHFPRTQQKTRALPFAFGSVLFFGLIHGLGFSMQLRALLGSGDNLMLPLVYFNLGLEAAQNIIVISVIGFSLLLTAVINVPGSVFKFIILCFSGLIALFMTAERLLQL